MVIAIKLRQIRIGAGTLCKSGKKPFFKFSLITVPRRSTVDLLRKLRVAGSAFKRLLKLIPQNFGIVQTGFLEIALSCL